MIWWGATAGKAMSIRDDPAMRAEEAAPLSCPSPGTAGEGVRFSMSGESSDRKPRSSLRQLPQAGRRREDEKLSAVLGRMRYKIFVMSGKGGVGKSSVSVNLAVALSEMGFRTGLLDVDMHGPSVPHLLGISENIRSRVENSLLIPVRARENLLVLSLDILLQDREQAIIWRGPKKAGIIRQLLADAAWGDLDFLFVDSPPGTGDEHLNVLRMIPDAFCLVVSTPQAVALADVRKSINFLKLMRAKIFGIVENMGSFRCPHCGGTIVPPARDGVRELARQAGISFLGSIPFDGEAAMAADKGRPAVSLPQGNPAGAAFHALAEYIKETLSG
ncbi:MAG: Mrp/NBP35 family ATP-binding protein [Deltaproteobacteria bacterium]|nr:Mrp/NBP35 family ATP-binding protein [Deltaproteobacteria bacterium]